ncbi:PREDICTED: uncharacterized protein LOC108763321 [Trachymyrmex cornetzi]|nr:PREDICTED: uncharacterized protein LOC108763321 [Trachymyrmex cornetzi]
MSFIINKGKKILQIISALRGTWWGAHPHMLISIYRSMLRASIEYSAHIFGLINNDKSRALQVLQNQALRLCFGYRISTPLNVIYAETVELSLPFRFRLLTSRYFMKISSVRDHPAVLKLHELCDLAMRKNRMDYLRAHFPAALTFRHIWTFHQDIDCSFTLPNFRHSFHSTITSSSYTSLSVPSLESLKLFPNLCAQALFDHEFSHLTAESTVFYTDGSKVDHGTYVGAAVFSPQLRAELMYRLSSYTSVFSAEAYAIYNAVTLSIDLHLRKVSIVTDSKSVLDSISGSINRTNNYLIPLIKAGLEEAEANGTRIQFIWVPSHKGITGNEKADQLAKRAIRQGIEPNFKVPYSDMSAVIKQRISDNFYRHLESMAETKGAYFFTHIFRKSSKPWYFHKKISREIIVILNRLRSDHYNLNFSLYRKNLFEEPSCPCGSPRQDIIHLIYDCPYTYVQARYLRRMVDRTSNAGDNANKFSQAISDPSECVCRLILNLCKACNRHF